MIDTFSTVYPTEKEILDNPPKDIKKDILVLIDWKEKNYKSWKNKSINHKLIALEDLLVSLSELHTQPCKILAINNIYSYDPNKKTVYLSLNKPSIISTLHEFGHHLYGESELKACTYSVWMFKTVFPAIFKNLKFDGHMVKRHVNPSKNS